MPIFRDNVGRLYVGQALQRVLVTLIWLITRHIRPQRREYGRLHITTSKFHLIYEVITLLMIC